MADLSPAAWAVMVAATNGNTNVVNDPVYRQCIAAALRVAVDLVVPARPSLDSCCEHWEQGIRHKLLAIAADLLERQAAPVPVTERLSELRGMFERILCVARSSNHIQLADQLIKAVVTWKSDDGDLFTLDQLRDAWNAQADAANSWDDLGGDEIVWWAQKQVLNRWGRPATPPAPAEGEVGDALAARPLLEKVARLGDVIGQQTVAQVQQLAEQATAWLQENPPGQPVAIEPRGCPTPGACSCVEPAPPAPAVVPVAASERPWDREGWCDTDGRCWLHFPDRGIEPLWRLTDPLLRSRYHSHCLPAHALPLPSGEVEG